MVHAMLEQIFVLDNKINILYRFFFVFYSVTFNRLYLCIQTGDFTLIL